MKPIKESKRERFMRVAEARTAKIISMIRLLGIVLTKQYQAKDLKKIFKAIDDALEDARIRYSLSRTGTKDVFSLR